MVDANKFLQTLFDQCDGVVVTCNAEEGFKARRWKPGRALTGAVYYCISTVADTNPRDAVLPRQAQHLVKTYAVVLDDVGTKVDKAKLKGKLAPTGKLRTSMPKGVSNEQWVYAFDEGVPPERAAALIEALAAAGLTDGGAKRADRIMRLPGSLNEKYSPPFATEVLEWHPERLYTFSEVCVGLGVVPTDTLPLPTGPVALPDGMIDPIDAWNHDNDRVTGHMNARGWYPLTCPLEHEHTGEVDHGCDYKPGLPGVFKCQHEHAGRPPLTTAWYREWIKEQDPGADLSIMPRATLEELGAKLATALGLKSERSSTPDNEERSDRGQKGTTADKSGSPTLSEKAFKALQGQLAAGGMFPLPETERPPTPGQEVAAAILDDIIHVASESRFWSRSTRCLLDAKAVDNRWYPILDGVGLLDRPKRQPMKPHEWLMQNPCMERVSRITHRLGKPLIVDDCLNLAPALPPVIEYRGEPTLWLELIAFICKDNLDDSEWVLDWCALVVSDFDEKPGFHLMLKGKSGTGKNMSMLPLVNYLQPDHQVLINTGIISSGFTSFLTKRLVSVDELKMTSRGSGTPHDILANVKAWTARSADTITINEKGMKHFQAADRSAWVITSNEDVPLPLEDDDRRFMVLETPPERMAKAKYAALARWLETGGTEVVIGWLQRRWAMMDAIDRQGLREHAPMTGAKLDLIDNAAEGINGAIRLAIAGRHSEAWPELMTVEDAVLRLKAASFNLLPETIKRVVTIQKVRAGMQAAGAVLLGRVRDADRNKLRLWCTRTHRREHYEQIEPQNRLAELYQEMRRGVDNGGNVVAFKPR